MRRSLASILLLLAACSHDRDPLDSVSASGGADASTSSAAADTSQASTGDPQTTDPTGLTSTGAVACGDLSCEPGEDCATCPADCGACPSGCGNLSCEPGEDCATCPADCGACPPTCPNGQCDNGEACDSCPADCGACPLGFPPGGAPDPGCIGGDGDGGPTCGGIGDAYTKAAVNVGLYPFRIKAGVATNLYSCDTRVLEPLVDGQGFAAQSTRNPTCLDNPPLRPDLNGYVFGYARGTGRSGWVPADALEFTGYSGGPCADGPASADFQVAHNPYDGCKATLCDDPAKQSCTATNTPPGDDPDHTKSDCGGAGMDQPREVVAEDLYLRFAPLSTASRYLHKGDRIRVKYDNKKGWVFVEVTDTTCPLLTPVGVRGWVENKPEYFKIL